MCYSPRKRPEIPEITSFLRFRETRVTGSQTVYIHMGTQNSVLEPKKTARNHDFLRFRESRVTGSQTVYIHLGLQNRVL